MAKEQMCIDYGTEFCPCYLAETGNCLICSQLQGKEFCDCNWNGICVYQEFLNNNSKPKNVRKYYEGSIEEIKNIGLDSYQIKIKTDYELVKQLRKPGSYVFIRYINTPQFFDVPMSIMQSDLETGTITIAYKAIGVKTDKLSSCKDKILVKGPFWNGIFGIKKLNNIKEKKCLIVARGISQATILLVLEKIKSNKNDVILLIDKGSIGEIFIYDYIKNHKLDIFEADVMSEEGTELITKILKNQEIDFIYSAGSDLLHQKIIKIMQKLNIDPYLAVTNNTEICCGEGVCGACTLRLKNGKRIKTCKIQADVKEIIERRVSFD